MAEAVVPAARTGGSADAPHPEGVTSNATPPEGVVLDTTPPEEVVTSNVTTPVKKPRKPRAPKGTPRLVAKLATVTEGASGSENSTSGPSSDVADVELRPSKEPQLPLEFWTGLMQTQKVIMAKWKSDHYNSFRIV